MAIENWWKQKLVTVKNYKTGDNYSSNLYIMTEQSVKAGQDNAEKNW